MFARLLRERILGPRYKYAQMALLGLLRVRAHQPWALMADRSPAAHATARVLKEVVELLEEGIRGARHDTPERRRLERKLEATEQCVRFLTTSTGRPDILSLIDGDE